MCQRNDMILEENTRECVVCYETDASLEAIISGKPQNIILTFANCGHSLCALCFGNGKTSV